MRSFVLHERWPWLKEARDIRGQLLDLLRDADLTFTPGGDNVPLGVLLCRLGEVERSYINSLQTFRQDWSAHPADDELAGSVPRLRAWYQTLDDELEATIAAFSDEDLGRLVDRGRLQATVERQIAIYGEALLLFYGKALVYLKALRKPVPEHILAYFD